MTKVRGSANSDRIVVWVPGGRDGMLTADILERESVSTASCQSLDELRVLMSEGAAAALLTEEVLTPATMDQLRELLAQQPAWSDFPLVIFSEPRGEEMSVRWDALRSLANVTFLDRPVRVRSMLAAIKSALRSRRRQHDARHAIESRDQFLAMLGHELRNPLSAIRFAVERHQASTAVAARDRAFNVIDRQSRHLSRLVDDLLDVARVTHGKISLHDEIVDVAEVAGECFDALAPVARENNAEYTFTTNGRVVVHGDRSRLEQVFTNLIGNALKYTPRNGKVAVTVEPKDGQAEVRISDTGIGIATDMLDRIFDVFAQAEPSLDRAQGGMGLGLTVVQNIVKLHGGNVRAYSDGLGCGSELVVRVPLAEAHVSVAPTASNPPISAASRRRIVLVEDSEDIREIMAELLREAGYDVIPTRDGPEGLEQICHAHPDIAFVDIGIPGFDGFELARRVRATNSRVPLVALSGYGQAEDRARAHAAGFDHHLTKPVGLAEIQAVMNEL